MMMLTEFNLVFFENVFSLSFSKEKMQFKGDTLILI